MYTSQRQAQGEGKNDNVISAVLSALPVSGRALRVCIGDPFEAALRRNNHGKR